MSHLNHYKVITPSGSTTVLQLSEETAKRDYPSAVLIGDAVATPDPSSSGDGEDKEQADEVDDHDGQEDSGEKEADTPKNKAAPTPQNKATGQ